MSVGSVTSSSNLHQTSSSQIPFAALRKNFKALEEALKSGDLKAAQSAFAEIQKNAPKNPSKSSASTATEKQDPFAALAGALQSGDLKAAKSAFESIQDLVKSLAQQKNKDGQGVEGVGASQAGQGISAASLAAMTSGMFMSHNSGDGGTTGIGGSGGDLMSMFQKLGSKLDLRV